MPDPMQYTKKDGTTNFNQQTTEHHSSDPSLPPRLSRRERGYYCFHIELSSESSNLLPSLIRYIISYGARYSAFLDINVTHIITDKSEEILQTSTLIKKLGCKIIGLNDFLQKVYESYQRNSSQNSLRVPLSPTLKRAVFDTSYSRDLSQMLAQEKKIGNIGITARASRAITPLYNPVALAATNLTNNLSNALGKLRAELGLTSKVPEHANMANSPKALSTTAATTTTTTATSHQKVLGTINDKKVIFETFKHPFMLLEEENFQFAPVFKEYAPNEDGNSTFPILNMYSAEFHCPFATKANRPIAAAPPLVRQVEPCLRVPNKHRADNTLKILSQHRTKNDQVISSRRHPIVQPRGVGRAPLPKIAATIATQTPGDRPRPGFCECCYERYSHLERHLRKENHRKLVSNSEFYRVVDRVIATLTRPVAKAVISTPPTQENIMLSPAKSVTSQANLHRVKSVPLRNITNHLIPNAQSKNVSPAMEVVEIESDSPIYSSPSLKRRRSARLVERFRMTSGKLQL